MPFRFSALAVLVVVSFGTGESFSEPPEAPLPQWSLAELAREYRKYGLPLPPPNAEVVRVYLRQFEGSNEEAGGKRYLLALRVPPAKPGGRPIYLAGDGQRRLWNVDPDDVKLMTPDQRGLMFIELDDGHLALIIQCELLGRHDIAQALYRDLRERFAKDDESFSAQVHLRQTASSHWIQKINVPGSDRNRIAQYLTKITDDEDDEEKHGRNYDTTLLQRLKATIAPRKSKPGSMEALVDGLSDYSLNFFPPLRSTDDESCWKVAEQGRDAVPTLIDHLNDERLSRGIDWPRGVGWPYRLTVGHLCCRLLDDLSAHTIRHRPEDTEGNHLDPALARAWLEKAQAMGEERWLVEHAIPPEGQGQDDLPMSCPQKTIVRAIAAKYPARLPAIYRAMLRRLGPGASRDFVDEILASKLPREQKLALFEEGAAHQDLTHRWQAIKGLAALAPERAREHMRQMFRQGKCLPDRVFHYRMLIREIVEIVEQVGDQQCWDSLGDIVKAADSGQQATFLCAVGKEFRPDAPDRHRRARLRFLARFLNERERGVNEVNGEPLVVCRLAANYLAVLHGVRDRYTHTATMFMTPDERPLSGLLFRAEVLSLTTRELARPEQ